MTGPEHEVMKKAKKLVKIHLKYMPDIGRLSQHDVEIVAAKMNEAIEELCIAVLDLEAVDARNAPKP